MKLATFLLISAFVFGQDAAPPPPLELNAAEKQFQESLNNVTLTGYFTQGDGKELTEDKYVIERVTKVKEDTWKFEARIQYNKKDFKVAMPLPVKFAGDTPVISLTNFAVPGFGSFTARVVMYNGAYAGTWGSAGANGHGGKLFGKIVKNEPAPAAPTDKPQP
ncbi:MAG TPA: hypothetical protein VK752_27445 [Bryobacteraceae bacterium]|jgi:hypothetical protein|nr:hypothetical protein [Bryobacteraceae bacterium]